MSHPPNSRPRDEGGAVAVLVAVLALTLLVVAGLVVDLGLARDNKQQSQIASDASALAGGNVLYPGVACTLTNPTGGTSQPCISDAVKAVKDYSTHNFDVTDSDWAACTDATRPVSYYVPPAGSPCISFDEAAEPKRVRVKMPTRTSKTVFGALAGVDEVSVGSAAQASLVPGRTRACGLCILGTAPNNLGNGDGVVINGTIWSNGNLTGNPNGSMTATGAGGSIHVVGSCSTINCSPAFTPETVPIDDPFASLALPPSYASLPAGLKSNPCSGGPGIYHSFTVGANQTCTLQPGLYVITGTWDLQATNSTIRSDPTQTGVTLYVTCAQASKLPRPCTPADAGSGGGKIDFKNGHADLRAPTTSPSMGALSRFAVIYDRLNTSSLDLQGNGSNFIQGHIYAPNAQIEFPGTTEFTVDSGTVVVKSLYGNGNTGKMKLSNTVDSPSTPLPPEGLHLDR